MSHDAIVIRSFQFSTSYPVELAGRFRWPRKAGIEVRTC